MFPVEPVALPPCFLLHGAHGCNRHPAFPAPSFEEGEMIRKPRTFHAARMRTHIFILQLSCRKAGKAAKFASSDLRWIPAQCDRSISISADFFLRPILECDMATFTRSQRLLVSVGAAALGGTALAMLLAGNIVTSRMRAQPPRTCRLSFGRMFRSATRRPRPARRT